MNRNTRHPYKKNRRRQENPFGRTLLAAGAVMLIVLLCISVNSLMPRIDPKLASLVDAGRIEDFEGDWLASTADIVEKFGA